MGRLLYQRRKHPCLKPLTTEQLQQRHVQAQEHSNVQFITVTNRGVGRFTKKLGGIPQSLVLQVRIFNTLFSQSLYGHLAIKQTPIQEQFVFIS